MANDSRRTGRTWVEYSISAVSLAVILGWAPAIYLCGYGMMGEFPLGGLLTCGMVVVVLFLVALVSYVTSAASGSRRRSFIALICVSTAGASLFMGFVCGVGLYRAGARARLQRAVDPEHLRQWALGIIPDTPQKEGTPIHLPNGSSISADRGGADEHGGYLIFQQRLPANLNLPLREPVGIRGKYDADPLKRYVEVGSFDRFGLTIVIGPTNLNYEPFNLDSGDMKLTNGIYIRIQGGG